MSRTITMSEAREIALRAHHETEAGLRADREAESRTNTPCVECDGSGTDPNCGQLYLGKGRPLCHNCGGSGIEPTRVQMVTCKTCDGHGRETDPSFLFAHPFTGRPPCKECAGNGKVPSK